ncbi:hypothetical protein BT96DRAFT_286887 [Gymnopus androsaceus JB14]|uniref:Uncharacterized protein n=1 Tax=Gymnopus androsaceus JB14 TaxID=1447944 RepID=A0A6A4H231_9AGAR|nr:hypothetical protein BT96DRAFT_286887 [Gymnopus androsaceus JB14]
MQSLERWISHLPKRNITLPCLFVLQLFQPGRLTLLHPSLRCPFTTIFADDVPPPWDLVSLLVPMVNGIACLTVG